MIQTIAFGVTAGCLAATLVGFAAIRANANLEAKIRVLHRLLLAGAIALLVLIGLFVAHGAGAPRLTVAGDLDVDALRAHLLAVQQHERSGAALLPAFAFVLLVMAPAVLHVLREGASFVLQQRTDLVARDQAASYGGR